MVLVGVVHAAWRRRPSRTFQLVSSLARVELRIASAVETRSNVGAASFLRQADALHAPKPSSNLAFRASRISKRLSCSASSDLPRQSSLLPQASPCSVSARPSGFGSARSKIPASSRREFLSKAPIFLWIPRRRGVSRGAAVEKSLLFADFQGFQQRRVSSRLGAQPSNARYRRTASRVAHAGARPRQSSSDTDSRQASFRLAAIRSAPAEPAFPCLSERTGSGRRRKPA